MFKSISVAALAALLLCSCITIDAGLPSAEGPGPQATTSPDRGAERSSKGLTYKLGMDPADPDNYCSATAVGPAALLTAKHCTALIEGKTITLDGRQLGLKEVVVDNMDHAIIVFKEDVFERYAELAKVPGVGDEVFMWGNSLFDSFLRRGYVSTFVWNQPFMDIPTGSGWMVIDMQVSGGDSGSGIFNRRGQLVAVLTGYSRSSSSVYATAMPFNFDRAEIAAYVPRPKHLSPE